MNTKTAYPKEKLLRMITNLATGNDNLKKRLEYAFTDVAHIKKDVFPEVLQDEWESLFNQATRLGPIRDENGKPIGGAIKNTCDNITDKEAEEIALKILYIYSELDNIKE